jgi:RES domain-containing protein
LIKPRVLRGYVVASIKFNDIQMRRLNPATLPKGWDNPVAPAILHRYGDDWIAAQDHLVLAVPSAIIAGEWKYLINPAHPDFAALARSAPEPFVFDNRLG